VETVFDRLAGDKKRLLDELRAQIMQLDNSIIEQVRPHRIVYSKYFGMMDFAEITLKSGEIEVTPIIRGEATPKSVVVRNFEVVPHAVEVVLDALRRLDNA